jgi:hypothetical protein
MRSQDTSTTGTPDGATNQANNTTSSNTNGLTGTNNQTQSSKIQVAAAVAVNITHHEAEVSFSGKLTAKSVASLPITTQLPYARYGRSMSLATKATHRRRRCGFRQRHTARVTLGVELTATEGNLTAKRSSPRTWTAKTRAFLARRRWPAP